MLRQTLIRALKWSGIQVDDTEGFDTIRFKSINMVDGYNVTIKMVGLHYHLMRQLLMILYMIYSIVRLHLIQINQLL